MIIQADYHVLPGFLLENGKPAIYDHSSGLLNGPHRLEAAQILAREKGFPFFFVGDKNQIQYLHQEMPGHGHYSVCYPERYRSNTVGNVSQFFTLIDNPPSAIVYPNLYYCWRWAEWVPGVRLIPSEAVLAAHYGWGPEELHEIYGTGYIANALVVITLTAAERLKQGEGGWLTTEELARFDHIIACLPTSDVTGPHRELIPRGIRCLFQGFYLERFLDELCGVADLRAGTYRSYR